MMKSQNPPNVMAPKPVHPRPVRTHGFLGQQYVDQHMMIDERWTHNSLTEEFRLMANLLAKRRVFLNAEINVQRIRQKHEFQSIRQQCRDGRKKLQMCICGHIRKTIHNCLMNHKDMQRLYQNLPLQQIGEGINQRTFLMRKEIDRLNYNMKQKKHIYEMKLMEAATLETRIKFQDEFVLEEDKKSREFRRKIENSVVRLRAIKTVNTTYNKMLQILRHDEIFYEPIINSLDKDIVDQAAFIKHILYIGMPAINRFNELQQNFRTIETTARRLTSEAVTMMNNLRKNWRPEGATAPNKDKSVTNQEIINISKRYVRETNSMQNLANELQFIENTMKKIKFATLCSETKHVYKRLKSQMDNNYNLRKDSEKDSLGHQHVTLQKHRAEIMRGLLVNNLSSEETKRLERIKKLREDIERENKIEAEHLAQMENRAHFLLLLRVSIWSLYEIVRYINVERGTRIMKRGHPNSYLGLPLLKFEMLTMLAVPPPVYQEDLEILLNTIKRAVQRLMNELQKEVSAEEIYQYRQKHHADFLESKRKEEVPEAEETKKKQDESESTETKVVEKIPDHTMIKALSRKLVEELSKKED